MEPSANEVIRCIFGYFTLTSVIFGSFIVSVASFFFDRWIDRKLAQYSGYLDNKLGEYSDMVKMVIGFMLLIAFVMTASLALVYLFGFILTCVINHFPILVIFQ